MEQAVHAIRAEPNTFEHIWLQRDFESVWSDADRQVLRGVLQQPGGSRTHVLAVAPNLSSGNREAIARSVHEHKLREQLSEVWAARPLWLDDDVLILHDPGGTVLANLVGAPISIDTFLVVAYGLAKAVAGMHKAGLVHRDIKPSHVLFDRDAESVHLCGFGIASRSTREHRANLQAEHALGTPAYMAPEQTGRMNRVVDARSDLYSVGVTLYELLTGALPFTANGAAEWAYCHLARLPIAPINRRLDTPAPLSEVVMKLLNKAAEDRYQTAAGLQADLRRCMSDWQEHRRIDAFPLGTRDSSGSLRFKDGLYGRQAEMDRLVSAYEHVAATGATHVVLVSGYSGIGKTALVNELQKVLATTQATFVSGKFDQYKSDVPYSSLAQAFQGLVRDLLGKPESEIDVWRQTMKAALGTGGRLIVNLLPEVQHLLGEQPQIADLSGQEARSRFLQVFRQFVGVFARKGHPLVLFLDDLQWLDAATLDVFESLAAYPGVHHLLLVGAYRSNEIGAEHGLAHQLERLRSGPRLPTEIMLQGIGTENVTHMVADALHASSESVAELASCILQKSQDNPFFTVQFIGSLVEKDLLKYDLPSARWCWDLDRIHGEKVSDNIVDLMIQRLARLPDASLKMVQAMACAGNRNGRKRFAAALDMSDEDISEGLREAVGSGLILESSTEYAFAHDRIHEAAYAMLSAEERRALHRRMGHRLLELTDEAQLNSHVFEIVSHFNKAVHVDSRLAERVAAAELNLRAGRLARSSAAYAAACGYLSMGQSQLTDSEVIDQHALLFALGLERAECTFLGGGIDPAMAMVDALLANSEAELELAAIYRLKVELHMVRSEHALAIDAALTALGSLGIPLVPHPDQQDVLEAYESVWRNVEGHSFDAIAELPLMSDPHKLAAMRLLAEAWPPAFFTEFNLAVLVVCKMVNLSLTYGSAKASNQGFALLGMLMGPSLGRFKDGYRLAVLACHLASTGEAKHEANRTFNTMAVTSAWTQPLIESVEWAKRAYVSAIESGDVYFACYSAFHASIHSYLRGQDLGQEGEQCREYLCFAKETGFFDGAALLESLERGIAALQGTTRHMTDFSDDDFDGIAFEEGMSGPRQRVVCQFYWTMKTMLHCLAGDPRAALAASENFYSNPHEQAHLVRHLEHHLYTALAAAAMLPRTPSEQRLRLQEQFDRHRELIRSWAEATSSPTYTVKDLLLGAEAARLEGRLADAERLYERGARAARRHGFRQCEALACELAAAFHRARGFDRIAEIYLRDAVDAYDRWGAKAKVKLLLKEHPGLRWDPNGSVTPREIRIPSEQMGHLTVLKGARDGSGELQTDQLLRVLLRAATEQAGAHRALLLRLKGKRAAAIAAEAIVVGGQVQLHFNNETAYAQRLASSLLDVLEDSGYDLVVDDALADPRFARDTHIVKHGVRSVLCLPIASYGTPQLALYLENHFTPRAFAPSQVNVLRLLTTQAAVSLDNARLYGDLALRDSKIRRLVDSDVIGILFWNLKGEVTYANDSFLRIVGYKREDLVNGTLNWRKMTPPEWMGGQRIRLRELKETGAMRPWEKEYICKDGSRKPVMIGAATFRGAPLRGVAFVLDLSERKAAEIRARESERRHRELHEELAHANRVATMGQLSTWIANDVMHPLSSIVDGGNAAIGLLLGQHPDLEAAKLAFESVVKEGMRAAHILDRTRELLKKVSPVAEAVDIHQVIAETVALISPEAERNGIKVNVLLDRQPMVTLADRVQLQQVILNLLVNAIEAMSGDPANGKELSISTSAESDEGLLVSVCDTGSGLPSSRSEDCFETFFSTKPGSIGIGLSLCRSIVELFGGRIWATRNHPRGAAFHFVLPTRLG